jgi:glycosyltransferase involved in cell wall biosynthesis
VPFVADLRDAWRDNPDALYPTAFHRDRSLGLERRVMGSAAAVTAVSVPIVEEASEMGARRSVWLPNGFDPADVTPWSPSPGPLRLVFSGAMYATHSDPVTLFAGLARAAAISPEAAEATVDVIGSEAPFAVAEAVEADVQDRVRFLGYRSHTETLARISRADAAVVLIRDAPGAAASYTGKLFEYLAAGLPILLVGPAGGVAADLVRETHAGVVVPFGDAAACAEAIARLAADKKGGLRRFARDETVVRRFDRRAQTADLAALLDAVVEEARS